MYVMFSLHTLQLALSKGGAGGKCLRLELTKIQRTVVHGTFRGSQVNEVLIREYLMQGRKARAKTRLSPTAQ